MKANKTIVSQSNVTWKVAADLKGCESFFPIPTTKMPDLVIWSEEEKEVHLVEFTVPHEDNISSAHEWKENRYEALVGECEETGWKAMHFPVEVGCCGYIATSITKWMRVAGLCTKKRNILTKALQETVEKASHWIWVKREDTNWSEWWLTKKAHSWTGKETSHRWGGSVRHKLNSCREEEPERATHSFLKISTPESSTWSIQL